LLLLPLLIFFSFWIFTLNIILPMKMFNAIIVVVVLLLIFYYFRQNISNAASKIVEESKKITTTSSSAKEGCCGAPDYEAKCEKATMEGFYMARDVPDSGKVVDALCEGEASFGTYDFGAPGLDYNSYVASQGVDDRVIEQHIQYTRDRKALGNETTFILGRTGGTTDTLAEGVYPVPWSGIAGLSKLKVPFNKDTMMPEIYNNPTQVPEIIPEVNMRSSPYTLWS
jgi:hypothetical protein